MDGITRRRRPHPGGGESRHPRTRRRPPRRGWRAQARAARRDATGCPCRAPPGWVGWRPVPCLADPCDRPGGRQALGSFRGCRSARDGCSLHRCRNHPVRMQRQRVIARARDRQMQLGGPVAVEQGVPFPTRPPPHGGQPRETALIDDRMFLDAWSRGSIPWLSGLLRMGQIRRANLVMIRNPNLSECRR